MIVNANDAREFEATLTIDRLNNLTSQLTNYYKSNGSGMPTTRALKALYRGNSTS